MDLFNLIGQTNPAEFLEALKKYMQETRRELNEINSKLDLLIDTQSCRKSA